MGLLDSLKGGTPGHKARKRKEPKEPEVTAEQLSTERRQRSLLDKEIEEEEDRLRLLRRGKLGRSSLLSGAPRTTQEAATGIRRAGAGVASRGGSLLGAPGRGGRGRIRPPSGEPRQAPN